MKIAHNITDIIGNTPILHLHQFAPNLYGKCEFLNPSHSVKDRPAYAIIDKALKDGKINKESIIVECTSGNMGISLAMICASLGLKIILTMPESMSPHPIALCQANLRIQRMWKCTRKRQQ